MQGLKGSASLSIHSLAQSLKHRGDLCVSEWEVLLNPDGKAGMLWLS
jgi:hypothetical protein